MKSLSLQHIVSINGNLLIALGPCRFSGASEVLLHVSAGRQASQYHRMKLSPTAIRPIRFTTILTLLSISA